jgi:hypothetical protein
MRITEQPSPSKLTQAKISQLLKRPAVWLPALVAVVAMATAAFGGAVTGWWGVLGLTAAGLAAAGGIYHWFVGRDRLQRRALVALIRESENRELERLKRLRQELRKDRDPHSTQLVRQLRETFLRLVRLITEATERSSTISSERENLDASAALYESCQRLLQRSLQLWQGAQDVETGPMKDELLSQRSQLLQQVEQSMKHLDASLDQMRAQTLREDGSLEVNQQLQDELRMGLETARRVEARMEALERELQFPERMERN